MDFGLQITNFEFPRLRDVAQMAEGLGFTILYLPDHIVYEGPERQANPEHLAYDVMVQAAVVAEATRRVRVGHLVLCNLFRHPVFTAQGITTLDHVSGGRAVAGLGTGWTETEFRMTGIPYPDITTRLRMLDEALTVLRGASGRTRRPPSRASSIACARRSSGRSRSRGRIRPSSSAASGRGLLRLAAKHADVVNVISEVGKGGYISMKGVAKLDRRELPRQGPLRPRGGEAPRPRPEGDPHQQRLLHDHRHRLAGGDAGDRARTWRHVRHVRPRRCSQAPLSLIGTPDECIAELKRRRREWEVDGVRLRLRRRGRREASRAGSPTARLSRGSRTGGRCAVGQEEAPRLEARDPAERHAVAMAEVARLEDHAHRVGIARERLPEL